MNKTLLNLLGAELSFYSGFANTGKKGDLIIDSCIIKNNYASEGTGLCFIDFFGSEGFFNLFIYNSYFEKNKASSGEGGGIFITGFERLKVNAQIENSYFIENQTRSIGMINISADSCISKISNSYFLNNKGYNSSPEGTHLVSSIQWLFFTSGY